jgi:hypothetical protein
MVVPRGITDKLENMSETSERFGKGEPMHWTKQEVQRRVQGSGKAGVNMAEALAAFRQMRSNQPTVRSDLCFKCGQKGHIAKYCSKNSANALESDQANFIHCIPCTDSSTSFPALSSDFAFMVKSDSESSEGSKKSKKSTKSSSSSSSSKKSKLSHVSKMASPSKSRSVNRTTTSKAKARLKRKQKSSSDESSDEKLLKQREKEVAQQEKRLQRLRRAQKIAERQARIDKEISLIESETRKLEKQKKLEKLTTLKSQEKSPKRRRKEKFYKKERYERSRTRERSRKREKGSKRKRSDSPDARRVKKARRPVSPVGQPKAKRPISPEGQPKAKRPRTPDRPPPTRPKSEPDSPPPAIPPPTTPPGSDIVWKNQKWSEQEWQEWKKEKNKKWYDWRKENAGGQKQDKDKKDRIPGQRKDIKDYVNYEAPVPLDQCFQLQVPKRGDVDPARTKERKRRKEERVQRYGEIAADRRNLRPKRTRQQIMCLPVWPKSFYDAVAASGEQEAFEKVESPDDALAEYRSKIRYLFELRWDNIEVLMYSTHPHDEEKWVNIEPGSADPDESLVRDFNKDIDEDEEESDPGEDEKSQRSEDEGDFGLTEKPRGNRKQPKMVNEEAPASSSTSS